MKLVNSLKMVVMGAATLSAVGCVSTAGMGAKQSTLSSDQWDNVAYGIVSPAVSMDAKKYVCNGVMNEPKCKDDAYFPVMMAVSFGYADGGRGLWGLASKEDLDRALRVIFSARHAIHLSVTGVSSTLIKSVLLSLLA